ncbi:MAG: AMP-binding protein [Burkholderiales bacterium]|nr:AMP-binding protein [Burkholderiales bacterium]
MLTMSSALANARRNAGSRVAIREPDRDYTWAEHVERVARLAGGLRALGLDAGARIGILSRNAFRQAELIHAGYWSGIVPVPVNVRLAPREIAFVLEDAGCSMLAVDPALLGLLEREELASWRGRFYLLSDRPGAAPSHEELIGGAAAIAPRDAGEDDDAILLYTGGTTGRAKGVRLTHRNVVANGLQVGLALGIRHDDTYLHVAPMFHSADLLATALTLAGATHVYLPEFSPPAYLGAIERSRVTFSMLAPTMLIMVLQHPEFARYDLSSLRIQVYGSSPMAESWIRRALDALPATSVTQGYGLTETAPILSFFTHRDHLAALADGNSARLACAGKTLPGVDLRIVDDAGDDVPRGMSGEVIVRGPNVTPGYYGLPEVNRETFRNGWFHTGDVGREDEDGFLYLLDRKKDMIVTGGENVYSSEVEAALVTHPGVAEAAVIAVPDDTYGEAVFAVVAARPGAALAEAELIAHCRGRIGGYKIPRRFAFVEALPKSALGKVLKADLRRRFGAPAAPPGG